MKTTTITKYETKDGSTFNSRDRAVAHELSTGLVGMLPEGTKLTSVKILDLMAAEPDKVIELIEGNKA